MWLRCYPLVSEEALMSNLLAEPFLAVDLRAHWSSLDRQHRVEVPDLVRMALAAAYQCRERQVAGPARIVLSIWPFRLPSP